MIRRALLLVLFVGGFAASGRSQSIRGHYVSKAEADGVIYHTLPVTLFESRTAGPLTFDMTYKEGQDGSVTINFTCCMPHAVSADSVSFRAEDAVLSGPVVKLYLEPAKKGWRHRYSLRTDAAPVCAFFDERTTPRVTLWSGGEAVVFEVKRSAWRSYAPVGFRIFEMIRVNEK